MSDAMSVRRVVVMVYVSGRSVETFSKYFGPFAIGPNDLLDIGPVVVRPSGPGPEPSRPCDDGRGPMTDRQPSHGRGHDGPRARWSESRRGPGRDRDGRARIDRVRRAYHPMLGTPNMLGWPNLTCRVRSSEHVALGSLGRIRAAGRSNGRGLGRGPRCWLIVSSRTYGHAGPGAAHPKIPARFVRIANVQDREDSRLGPWTFSRRPGTPG